MLPLDEHFDLADFKILPKNVSVKNYQLSDMGLTIIDSYFTRIVDLDPLSGRKNIFNNQSILTENKAY